MLLDPAPTNVLVVGLGGGTLPTALSELYPNASIDVVEIDPAVVVVAKRYFGFEPTEHMRVFEHDARVWAKRAASNSKRYDLIMLDAFNGDYIPEHLMTKEYLSETRELLTDEGVLASNTFAISRLYHNESVTYADVFGPFFNLRSVGHGQSRDHREPRSTARRHQTRARREGAGRSAEALRRADRAVSRRR